MWEVTHEHGQDWTDGGERSRGAFTHGCVCVNDMKPQERVSFFMCSHALSLQTKVQCRTEVCVFMCVCTCNGSWQYRGASSNSGWTDKDMWQHPGRFICQHRSERSHNDDSRRPIETPTTHTCTQSYLQPPMRSPKMIICYLWRQNAPSVWLLCCCTASSSSARCYPGSITLRNVLWQTAGDAFNSPCSRDVLRLDQTRYVCCWEHGTRVHAKNGGHAC